MTSSSNAGMLRARFVLNRSEVNWELKLFFWRLLVSIDKVLFRLLVV